MGYETPAGVQKYQGKFYKITRDNIEDPTPVKDQVSISNGLAWNKANDKLYYIDTPTKKIVEFLYDDSKGEVSGENRTAFDVAQYTGRISGSPDGMTIDQDDNLWIALYGGGAVIKANPTTGELLKVVPLPARDVTSAMWGGPDLDVLFVTTSRHSLESDEKMQQPGAGSVFAITNLGTKGLPAYTADIIDGVAKRKSLLENLLSTDLFAPLPRENSNLIYPPSNEILHKLLALTAAAAPPIESEQKQGAEQDTETTEVAAIAAATHQPTTSKPTRSRSSGAGGPTPGNAIFS
ncbi:hypothetical protein NQ317_009748 [Molorchus minor]|uniref:Regucalcin n=1 Tax=Molorchus minor TaxID=1323400 RepID=A0ABQ9IYY1_9CUCU|nr:hypothetical protein NQ317_009748 [Molorchus minor]